MWSFLTRNTFARNAHEACALGGLALVLGAAVPIGNHSETQHTTFPFLSRVCHCDKNLSKDEFSKLMKEKVAATDRRLDTAGFAKMMIWSVAGKPDTQSIEMAIPNREGDVVGLMAMWMEVLARHGVVEFHSQAEDKKGGKVVSFVSGQPCTDKEAASGAVSMIVRGDPSPSVQLFKDGGFSEVDVGLILEGYERVLSTRKKPSLPQYSAAKEFQDKSQQSRQHEVQAQLDSGDPVAELQGLGIDVYEAKDAAGKKYMTWDDLAGYSEVKKYINETILMPLQHPEVYDDVVKFTRQHVERNRPRAVLLEGPPGTGKTLTAKIIASESDKVMVHLPVESIASKYYGESEKKLSQIFDACNKLGGAIIFIDEIDSLVGSRDQSMHEATRRILSVLLQRVEGFQGRGENILIGATNRKQDLDAALISRFDTSIRYQLPDAETRQAILKRYAKHLGRSALHELSSQSEGFSSRDLKDLCEQAERRWAAAAIASESVEKGLPTSSDYLDSLRNKRNTLSVK